MFIFAANFTYKYYTMIDLKKRIQDICKEKGIKQKDLAKEMDITPVALAALLQRGDPHISTMERIAKIFDMTLFELMAEKNDKDVSIQIVCPNCKKRIGLFPMVMDEANLETKEENPVPSSKDEKGGGE